MRRDIEGEAAKMRAKSDAEYIREGTHGWKRRRAHVERRTKNRLVAEHRAAIVEQDRQKQTREALARLDAATGTKSYRAHKSETDTDSREQTLMGNADLEGKLARINSQKLRTDRLQKALADANVLQKQTHKPIPQAHPSVAMASIDDLIAAGWGDYERHRIPWDWRMRQPMGKTPPASAVKNFQKPN